MACDPTAISKTPAQLAAAATGALKSFDTKSIAGQDPKALFAKLPSNMQASFLKSPEAKNIDPSKIDMKNPGALLAKYSGLASMLG